MQLAVVITDFECLDTKSKYDLSLAVKSGFYQFVNTGVIAMIVSFLITKNVIGVGGLMENTFSVLVINALTG